MPQLSYRSTAVRLCTRFLLFLLLWTLSGGSAFSGDRPFNNSTNWGGTGLLEIPNARVLEDAELRLGFAQALPYRWYTGALGAFPGLEVSGRYTENTRLESGMPGYGNYKDKAADLKYQILPESKWFPAVAIGLNDFTGTGLYESQYLAFSRQIYPLDFTFGLGTKRLRGPATLPFTDDKVGVWGGIQWAVTDNFNLMAEYNPVQYEKDRGGALGVPEGAEVPINAGLNWRPLPGVALGASWQRGDTFGFMVNIQAELGKSIVPKRPNPPWWAPEDRTPFGERDTYGLVEKIKSALQDAGFRDVVVYAADKTLTAAVENTKYISNRKAAGRVLRILLYHSPEDTVRISVVLKRLGMPVLKVSARPDQFDDYLYGKISEEAFDKLLDVQVVSSAPAAPPGEVVRSKPRRQLRYLLGIKPMFQTYLNDPSGVFKFRTGIEPYAVTNPWQGGAALFRYDIPFYSDIRSSNAAIPGAVRSDSWRYLGDDPSLDRLLFDQTIRLSKKTFGRISAGYLESMYAGAGGEILTFLGAGRLALGLEGDWVYKREPGNTLDLTDLSTHTLLGDLYYTIESFQTTFRVQYGRFLAGDVGWRFQVERRFATGASVGFWYTITDTDDVAGDFNHGYHDKGVFLYLPVRMFTTWETNTRYRYSFRPWSRDVGATIDHWRNLFDFASDLMPADFNHESGDLRK